MKAIVCERFGPPETLVLADLPAPVPGPGEVLIEVRACGVNFPDTLIIQGQYQVKPPLPFTPGSDVAGVVTAAGADVRGFKAGDAVVTLLSHGGFAEQVVAPAALCLPKPPAMDFTQAAAFTMAYGTAYHALRDRARLKAGETLLVLGAAGGVGLTAVELGKLWGARVIAAASTAEKLALCREYGADEVINYAAEDLKGRIKELTGGRGVDVVYDPVGGALSEAALRGMAWNGRFLVIGFAAGDIPKIALNLPLVKGCAIVGVYLGGFLQHEPRAHLQNMERLVELFAQGTLKPHIDAVYPLAETARALRALAGRQVRGKVVIHMTGAA
jgi:NADPH2:quinone reductase